MPNSRETSPTNQNLPPTTTTNINNFPQRPNPVSFDEFTRNQRQNTSEMTTNTNNPNEISRVSMKPPAFSKRDPDLYFIQMESQFRNAGITGDQTKYDYIVGSLDSTTLLNISDIIRDPPTQNKYETVKQRLIKDFTDSENKKIHRLLQECELGDNKPSQLLRKMKDLANGALNDGALKTLWMGHLPESIRAIVVITPGDLDLCAQQADKMMEMSSFSGNITAIQHPPSNETQSLQAMIESLRKEIGELKSSRNSRGRSKTPRENTNRERNHSHNRSESQVKRHPTCYYHHRFGADAKKCAEPCDFKSKN